MKKCHMASLMAVTLLASPAPYHASIIRQARPEDGHTWDNKRRRLCSKPAPSRRSRSAYWQPPC
ncbi:hypothetical protein EHZ64_03210 [Aeromonas enteropelogenes]|nr:hypothetical protein EHZ64_03210 [Aeromonas enteropelogenes]